jgi:membrane associated rhomboid family serine protease
MTFSDRPLRAVPTLITLNVLIYLCEVFLASPRFVPTYALSAAGLEAGRWWQLLSHAFLHGNELHLLFNMVGLWCAGRIVERVFGTGRFLVLYVLAALAGGVFQLALGGPGLLLGASGAVFGVMLAFTTLFPENRITAVFFVFPIRLKAKFLGLGLTASAVFFLLTGWLPGFGHAAHLGGCVVGFFFTRHFLRHHRPTYLAPAVNLGNPPEANHQNLGGNRNRQARIQNA